MAMTQQLYSISGLATELGRDRRTIAAALSSVPPDGQKGAYPAWRLLTALAALDSRWKASPLEETFVGGLCERLDRWQQIYVDREPAGRVPVDAAAELLGVDRAAVLTWLRAGMPYAEAGDWRTGEGFEIVVAWAADWVAMVYGMAVYQGAETAAQWLRLP